MLSVNQFLSGLGVNVHLTYWDTPYRDVSRIQTELEYLGITNLREGTPVPDYDGIISELADKGYRFDFVTRSNYTAAYNVQLISAFEAAHPGSVLAIEGLNEVDLFPIPGTAPANAATVAAEFQRALYAGVRADSHLADAEIYTFTFGHNPNYQSYTAGDLSASSSAANIHVYHSWGDAPSEAWNDYLSLGQDLAAHSPTVITETGYQTRISEATGVDQRIQAIYTLETLFQAAATGVETTFLYELTDQWAAGAGEEFGLFAFDGSAKASAVALHNLNEIFRASSATAPVAPTSSAPSVVATAANGANLSTLTMRGEDGSVYLVVWRPEQLWDATARQEIELSPVSVHVRIGNASTVDVYDPILSSRSASTLANVTAFDQAIGDDPIVFRIHAATVAPTTSPVAGATSSGTVPAAPPVTTTPPTIVATPAPSDPVVPPTTTAPAATATTVVVSALPAPAGSTATTSPAATAATPTATVPPVGTVDLATVSASGSPAHESPPSGGQADALHDGLSGCAEATTAATVAVPVVPVEAPVVTVAVPVVTVEAPVVPVDDHPAASSAPAVAVTTSVTSVPVTPAGAPAAVAAAPIATATATVPWVATVDPATLSAFGSLTHDSHSVGGQVYALYEGLLGRAPDALGLAFWADAVADGMAPKALAASFLASPEGHGRAGAASNAAFVTQLFDATLHRGPDAVGLKFWVDALDGGTSRADVGVGFALSPEHLARIQPVLDAGLFVPDADAASVARIYYTTLGRAPDADGLKFWTGGIKAGMSLNAETRTFLDSPEAQSKVAGMTTVQYVDHVYLNALGRHAEGDGLAFWTHAIDGHTATRVDVTTAISQSAEAQLHLAPMIEQGWHLA